MQRVSYLHSLCWRKKNRIQLPWLQINDYQFQRFRKDRNKYEGGKCLFIRQGLITKRLPKFETKVAERICVELTICKITRLPQNNELNLFWGNKLIIVHTCERVWLYYPHWRLKPEHEIEIYYDLLLFQLAWYLWFYKSHKS